MFNLDHAIADWRRQMLAAGIKSPEILDELESHLRDDFDQQLQSALTEHQAFAAAVRRIGQASVLGPEFSKLATPSAALKRKILRLFCFVMAPLMLLIEVWTFVQFEISPLERTIGISLAFFVAFYLGGLPYWHKLLSVIHLPRFAAAFKTMAMLIMLWP